jgi:hypothetical protein
MMQDASSGQKIAARPPQSSRRAAAEDKPRAPRVFEMEFFVILWFYSRKVKLLFRF